MGRNIKRILIIGMSIISSLAVGIIPTEAAEETSSFGSASYEWTQGIESPIGVYVSSGTPIYYMEMIVTYDPEILQYSSGGELEEEGRIKVEIVGEESIEVSQMLYFVPLCSGTTAITIENVIVQYESGETAAVASTSVPITVPLEEGCALNSLLVNGKIIEGFQPDILSYTLDVAENIEKVEVTAVTDSDTTTVEISDTSLVIGENRIRIATMNEEGKRAVYTLTVNRVQNLSGEGTTKEEKTRHQEVEVLREEKEEGGNDIQRIVFLILAGLFFILAVLLFLLIRISERKRRNRRRYRAKRIAYQKADLLKKVRENDRQKEVLNKTSEIEIDVQHVTMIFKREKDEATSIKELLIRTIKRQRSYELFKALDDVSFTVYKGEVVGIIGTNGSGKSTILKIISGVLVPTKGQVIVDKNKIQLLTLGTGFDFELTGRENVYLNGAIIGYTKEFIDEKYEDIVKFAELEGFMEEKVRNYSSGMVSRLGFAIATIRDTPEILILDEVLSVGDMFFQKKSSARIKEMMNGGSTVLIVSHSTSVIKSNCTKAVWIEKGRLRAFGTPEEVCEVYEKMNQE